MKTKSAAIAGLHIRYDIATKCAIVKSILSQSFTSNKHINAYIATLAAKYNVTDVSIKLWCAKYATTYKQGLKLPAGVMSFEFNPIQDETIAKAQTEVAKLREQATKLKCKYHNCKHVTPSEILNELITTAKV
jgi:hypothetical protein